MFQTFGNVSDNETLGFDILCGRGVGRFESAKMFVRCDNMYRLRWTYNAVEGKNVVEVAVYRWMSSSDLPRA